jgi:hypothetical protein
MSKTNPTPKSRKKKTEYVDLNEILENIASSIENLAGNDEDLRDATATLNCRLAELEDGIAHWKTATIISGIVSIISIAIVLLR